MGFVANRRKGAWIQGARSEGKPGGFARIGSYCGINGTVMAPVRHQIVFGFDMNGCKLLIILVRPAGFEPATLCLEGILCSVFRE